MDDLRRLEDIAGCDPPPELVELGIFHRHVSGIETHNKSIVRIMEEKLGEVVPSRIENRFAFPGVGGQPVRSGAVTFGTQGTVDDVFQEFSKSLGATETGSEDKRGDEHTPTPSQS